MRLCNLLSLFLLPLAINFVLSSGASASLITTTVFSADFTSAPFTTGGLNNNGGSGIQAATAYQIATDSGVQTARNFSSSTASAGFGRIVVPESIDLVAQTVAVGDMITIEMVGLTILSDTSDTPILSLGLATNGGSGSAGLAIGGYLARSNNSSTDIVFSDSVSNGVGGTATGKMVGDKFDFLIKLTAESAGSLQFQTYTKQAFIDGVGLVPSTGATILPGGGGVDTFLRGFHQDTDGNTVTNARFTFEGFNVQTVATAAVPEPTSLLMFGLCLGGMGFLRRSR